MCELGSNGAMRNPETDRHLSRSGSAPGFAHRSARSMLPETQSNDLCHIKRRTRPTPRLLPAGCVALQKPKGGIRCGDLKRSQGTGMEPAPHSKRQKPSEELAMSRRDQGQQKAQGQSPGGTRKVLPRKDASSVEGDSWVRANQDHAVILESSTLRPNPCERSPPGTHFSDFGPGLGLATGRQRVRTHGGMEPNTLMPREPTRRVSSPK
jgi:hypothetical protein